MSLSWVGWLNNSLYDNDKRQYHDDDDPEEGDKNVKSSIVMWISRCYRSCTPSLFFLFNSLAFLFFIF